MHGSIKTNRNGSTDLHLDSEAARAVFASVIFAARFHEGIAPLTKLAEKALQVDRLPKDRSYDLCQ